MRQWKTGSPALKRFLQSEDGVTSIEYGMIAIFFVIILAVAVPYLSNGLNNVFFKIGNVLNNVFSN